MTLNNQITADTDDVFFNTDEFAEEIIYTPVGGYDEEIEAIVDRGDRLEPYVRGEETATLDIMVKATNVTDPQHGDRYTITNLQGEDEVWEFLREFESGQGIRKLTLERTMEE